MLAQPFSAEHEADPFGDWPQWRKDMGLGPHRGKDYNGLAAGTAIPASGVGVCTAEGWSAALGWWVVIRYADPSGFVYFGYCHMKERTHLRYGNWVAMGNRVGFLGETGSAATGPHLHLTASRQDGNPGVVPVINPDQFFGASVAGGGDQVPITTGGQKEMRLAWSTDGTGWLVTEDGWAGLPSMQYYNLFKRLINSNQASNTPETFNRAEVDMMNSYLQLLARSNSVGTTIDPTKLASAIVDQLRKQGVPVTIENLQDANFTVDPAELAKAMEAVVPRVSNAIVKAAGEAMAKSVAAG